MSGIVRRLRSGVPDSERRRVFDAVSLPVYLTLLAIAAVTVLLVPLLGFTVDFGVFVYALWALWLWFGGMLIKRVGHGRIGTAMEVIGLLYAAGFVFFFLIAALTAVAGPDADWTLAAADQAIGFDWLRVARFLEPHQDLLRTVTAIYRSLVWQPALVVALLCVGDRRERAWMFVLAWFTTLAICSAIYPFVPAIGPMRFHGITPDRFPGLLSDSPWTFGSLIHGIRDQGVRHLGANALAGLITFPSFHAAGAVILAWAAWPIRIAGPLLLAVNLVMLAATIICGPHYLVDLVGGVAIAIATIYAARRITASLSSRDDRG